MLAQTDTILVIDRGFRYHPPSSLIPKFKGMVLTCRIASLASFTGEYIGHPTRPTDGNSRLCALVALC